MFCNLASFLVQSGYSVNKLQTTPYILAVLMLISSQKNLVMEILILISSFFLKFKWWHHKPKIFICPIPPRGSRLSQSPLSWVLWCPHPPWELILNLDLYIRATDSLAHCQDFFFYIWKRLKELGFQNLFCFALLLLTSIFSSSCNYFSSHKFCF